MLTDRIKYIFELLSKDETVLSYLGLSPGCSQESINKQIFPSKQVGSVRDEVVKLAIYEYRPVDVNRRIARLTTNVDILVPLPVHSSSGLSLYLAEYIASVLRTCTLGLSYKKVTINPDRTTAPTWYKVTVEVTYNIIE